MRKNYSFTDFKKRIAFLQQIPMEVASHLSVDEFYYPDPQIQSIRKDLEAFFNHYVMSYKAEVFLKEAPLHSHLCANYKGAILTKEQVSLLNEYESRFQEKNVRFVVYQKPLTKISSEESPFFI
ncbi:MAG TPA: hypothetical protein VLF93_00755 [Candidatus Saccharimonadales bacterium]|nr:hypothetical protein [Candidatus Saccharimonadales bacterium]